MQKEAKRILIILISLILVFLLLIVYLTWFQVFRADIVKSNNYNKRQWIYEEKIMRGSFFDREGRILAYNEKLEDTTKRVYNYSNLYSHIIGYSYREYGKSALESSLNKTLLGMDDLNKIEELKNEVVGKKTGNSVKLTISHELQEKSRELMDGKKGATLTMNSKTGEIYSMVSYPDYNVNDLKQNWNSIVENTDSPLLNRVTQGLYEPGSTFKIISSSAMLENHVEEAYNCKGSTIIDGYEFKDYNKRGHGNINLESALVKSCNSYYVDKVMSLGKSKFANSVDNFYINKKIPIEIDRAISTFKYNDIKEDTELAASAIGQGKVLVTPLNMALATSAIVNEGQMVKPTLVKEILSSKGDILNFHKPEIISNPLSKSNANRLKNMMVKVIETGTGSQAKIKGLEVGGKTGTAENSSGKSHAWFVGFTPYKNDEYIVTVVVLEQAGATGGKVAAPIAREILKYGSQNL